jgi:hypothetical protein
MFQKMEHTDEWMTHWLYPLLNAMEKNPNGQSFESSLVDLLKLHPEMIYNVETWCQVDRPSRLAVYITALLACRKLGLFPTTDVDAPQEKVWNNALKVDVLEQALNHSDGKVIYIFVFYLKLNHCFNHSDSVTVKRSWCHRRRTKNVSVVFPVGN